MYTYAYSLESFIPNSNFTYIFSHPQRYGAGLSIWLSDMSHQVLREQVTSHSRGGMFYHSLLRTLLGFVCHSPKGICMDRDIRCCSLGFLLQVSASRLITSQFTCENARQVRSIKVFRHALFSSVKACTEVG